MAKDLINRSDIKGKESGPGSFLLVFDCEAYSTEQGAIARAKEINLRPEDGKLIIEVNQVIPWPSDSKS